MRLPLHAAAAICVVFCNPAYSQGLVQMRADAEAKLEAAQKGLREAMVSHRDIHLRSCKIVQTPNCELATLTDVQLMLLDLETKYRRAARDAATSDATEKLKKVKDAAEEAREKVYELAQILGAGS